jgi:hypothetical protein
VHSQSRVEEVFALRREGLGARRIAKHTNMAVGTVRDWLAGRLPRHSRTTDPSVPIAPTCHTCGHPEHRFDELPREYAYLLGLYLGDGCISGHARDVFRLRIFLDLRYPQIIDDCAAAIAAVVPNNKIHRLERWSSYVERDSPSHVEVSAFSKVWPCLFPQHGAGRKHERRIQLAGWQRAIVDRWPDQLLRGLIHSDGCRFINTGRGNWSWPRYGFDNKSEDICEIFGYACDQLGVHWTVARSKTRTKVYVSRKADVAKLDEFIGPKC